MVLLSRPTLKNIEINVWVGWAMPVGACGVDKRRNFVAVVGPMYVAACLRLVRVRAQVLNAAPKSKVALQVRRHDPWRPLLPSQLVPVARVPKLEVRG